MISIDSHSDSFSYFTKKLLPDFAFSLRSWRVWFHLGMQSIRQRYRRSTLGGLWLFIHLAIYAGAVGVVYGKLFNQPVKDFLPYLLIGFNLWGFLMSSFLEGGTAFITAEGYVKQISFPKQVYLLRNLVSAVFTSLMGFVVFFLMVPIFHIPIGWGMLWAIPGFAIFTLCNLGHIWIMAYLCTRFRDLSHAINSLLQILYFLVPVLYPEKLLADHGYAWIYQFNPLYWLITVVRYPLLTNEMIPQDILICSLIYMVALWGIAMALAARMDRKVVYWL